MKNIRTCISCNGKYDKNNLIKITMLSNGEISTVQSNKINGRSCYVCKCNTCIDKVITKKLINKNFHKMVSQTIYDELNNMKGVACDK